MKTVHDRNKWLVYKYGITLEEYEHRLAIQGGRCAICGRPRPGKGKRQFAVDHCHKTGTIRGLICTRCNVTLAAIGDTPERAMRFVHYLLGRSPRLHSVDHRKPYLVTSVRYFDACGRRVTKDTPGAVATRETSKVYMTSIRGRRIPLGTRSLDEAKVRLAMLLAEVQNSSTERVR